MSASFHSATAVNRLEADPSKRRESSMKTSRSGDPHVRNVPIATMPMIRLRADVMFEIRNLLIGTFRDRMPRLEGKEPRNEPSHQ